MEYKGRLKSFSLSETGRELVLDITEILAPGTLPTDCELDIKITPWKAKRSLSANAYFHVLNDRLAKKLNISIARCKNILISRYGVPETIDGEQIVYKSNAPVEYMIELETIHTMPVRVTEENGKPVTFYRVYRPTHLYNTAEMATLLDGTIAECQEQGIETCTPQELERIKRAWNTQKV